MAAGTRENTVYVKYVKYSLEKIMAAAAIALLWWLYAICALAVAVSSGFPVIYRQERAGCQGRPFGIYKFRTMVKNADKIGPAWTADRDPRITRAGAFLRRTSLDEIPQLFNVVKGDMALIGYRPDVVRENEDYTQNKYLLKPGITGLAQINGRSSLTPEEKEYWENLYPRVVSFKTDAGIFLKTVSAVFSHRGTN